MKPVIVVLSLLIHGYAVADVHAHTDPATVHGMAVVGSERIYLSHLPMFHSPHDYQVLLEVEFDAEAKRVYKQSKAASDETVYTIAPSAFVLATMAQAGKSFSARLYRGHFERGGVLLQTNVTINIKRVLLFKEFQSGEVKPQEARFLLFGNQNEQFMAHLISAKPDFDQIVGVHVSSAMAKKFSEGDSSIELTLLGLSNEQPLQAPANVRAISPSLSQPIDLKVLSNLYLETGDLAF